MLFVNFGCGKKKKYPQSKNPSVTQNDSNETTELKDPVTPDEEVVPVEDSVTPNEEPVKITVDLDTVEC